MRRREFITLVGGAAAWPLTAQTQQVERPRRIGVLMSTAESDRNAPARIGSFLRGLEQLGWIEGHNIRLDLRWAAGDLDLSSRRYAAELVALAPDVLLATAGPTVAALQAETALCRSYLHTLSIRSAPVSSPVSRGPTAMLQGLSCSSSASARNGWSCSKTLHPTLCEWRFFAILHRQLGSASSRLFKRWLGQLG